MKPEITGFSPAEGEGGSVVTITGKNFSSETEGNTVIFGRRQAFIEQASPEQLVVKLPDNMNLSGPVKIEVTTDGGKAVSGSTFLLHGCIIESFEPASLMIGDTLYIHATGIASSPGENLIKIGNTNAEILSVNDGLIKIVAPYSATLGKKELSLAAFGKTCYSADSVNYKSPWDKITGANTFFRAGEAGFVCDSKVYVGFGTSVIQGAPGSFKDLWSFNLTTGVLTKCADLPSGPRELPAAFSIGNKGYAGLGFYNSGSTSTEFYTDFFEYDPASDSWTQKAGFPDVNQRVTVSFQVGNKGYVMSGSEFFEIWEYNQENDHWNRLNDFSSFAPVESHGVENGGKAYVFGQNRGGLWEYSPADDSWKILADFPGEERAGAVSFSLGEYIYRGSGYSLYDSFKYLTDFWRYDIRNDKWTRITDLPYLGRAGALGYTVGMKAYICSGYNVLPGSGMHSETFVVYNPE
jgi:N-acetylneuraminic acid mutarotase